MKSLYAIALALTALVGASCGGIKPLEVNAGDLCYRCRRVILEPRMAAEMIDPSSLAFKFRTTGCLAKYLNDHPNEKGTLFVTDFPSGRMMGPELATFVPMIVDENTNERDYRAFLRKSEADAFAKTTKTTPVDWKTVLATNKT